MKFAFLFYLVAAASPLFSADIPGLECKAKQGDADGQFELARACLKGDGVTKDTTRALELMTAAANQGHAEAMGGMGFFYANGTAVPKDEAKAVEWFRKGAEKGGPKAQLNLGKMLAKGKGVEKNQKEGLKWIKAAADQGLTEALVAEGELYFFGDYGQALDYAKAYPYLLKAAENGHPDAQNNVGVMLENGQGTGVDTAQAEEWYRKAARQGHTKAQSNLGMLLGPENQDPTKRVEALTWLMVASDKSDVTAQKLLDSVKEGLNRDELAQARRMASELEASIRTGTSKYIPWRALRRLRPLAFPRTDEWDDTAVVPPGIVASFSWGFGLPPWPAGFRG